MPSPEIDVQIIDQPDDFRALESEWKALCGRVPGHGHYLTFDWHWRAWDSYHRRKGRRLCIAVGRDDGRLVLILPLVADIRGNVRRARWLGAVTCFYADALVLPGSKTSYWLATAWRLAIEHARVDFAFIENVREDGMLHTPLAALPGTRVEAIECIGIAWRDWADWDAYWKSISASLRKNQAKQYQRLRDHGETRFETVSDPAEITRTMHWIVDQKRAWLSHRGNYGDRFDDAETAFLHDTATDAGRMGSLYLGRILVGESIIAAELGFIDAERLNAIVTTYDRAWQRYSPGRLMYENSIRWSCQNGMPFYDLNTADDPYKAIWGRSTTPGADFWIPCSWTGRLYLWWYDSSARKALRAAYRYSPLGLRKMLRARLYGSR